MGRIINPVEIAEQVYSIEKASIQDRVKLSDAMADITAFLENDELQGDAWSRAKGQIEAHNTVIKGLVCMLSELQSAGNRLVVLSGTEVLDEDVLQSQLTDLTINTWNYENRLANLTSTQEPFSMEWNKYLWQHFHFNDLEWAYKIRIEQNYQMMQEIRGKLDLIDEIDENTKHLYDSMSVVQAYVEQGLEYLRGSVNGDGTGFVCPLGAGTTWMKQINLLWDEYLNKEPEADVLRDMRLLDRSRYDGNVYVSGDKQSLFMGGQIYEIYVPDGEVSIDAVYETVDVKEKSIRGIKWLDLCRNLELEDPDLKTIKNDVQVLYEPQITAQLGAAIFAQSVINAMESGVYSVDISVEFQQTSSGRGRAIIMAGSYESRSNQQKLSYGTEMSLRSVNADNGLVQMFMSEVIFDMYNGLNGGKMVQEDRASYYYDINATFNENRRDLSYSSYLSFNSDGSVIETPVRFEGESARIVLKRGYFEKDKELMEITEYVYSPHTLDSPIYAELLTGIIKDGLED